MNFGDYNPDHQNVKQRDSSGGACRSLAAIRRYGSGVRRIVRVTSGSGLYCGLARKESRVGGRQW
jgi:hypothetical protein